MKTIVFFGVLAVALCGLACSFDGESSVSGLLKGLGVGALSGLSVAALGFAKDRDPNKKWDFKVAGMTALLGAIVGALAGWEKRDLTTFSDWLSTGSIVVVAELVWKVAWRNGGAPALAAVMNALKGASPTPPTTP